MDEPIFEDPDEQAGGTHDPRARAERRWRLALGADDDGLSDDDRRLSRALSVLYSPQDDGGPGRRPGRRHGLGGSSPKALATWLGDIRQYFPAPVVQIVQKDAFARHGLKQMLMEPEFLAGVERDINLVSDLLSLKNVMPDKAKQLAREVVATVVAELVARLGTKTAEAVRGAVDRHQRTFRPRPADIDWPRTITANLRHYQPEHGTVVPEKLVGFLRRQRRLVDLDEVVLCVDQSGSMAASVIYASVFAAVLASLPVVDTKLVVFDTEVVDLTEELADPVDVLFGIQLGGGTDVAKALSYCTGRIERPAKSHLVLITDLYTAREPMMQHLAALVRAGVNVIVLLALNDCGCASYDAEAASQCAALGIPTFACTPDQFPDLMATALRRDDIAAWAADSDIKLTRPLDAVEVRGSAPGTRS
ncbi:MAG: VWA domain-containing protein [Micrococcales bacterium]|nr:VWA domain-containing protein [Micrococcales bacterium]